MKNAIFIFLFLFSLQGLAQEDAALMELKSNYQMSEEFKAGSALIYDCKRGHYTCTDSDGYAKCKMKRDFDKTKGLTFYSCAQLKIFPTKVDCVKMNYEVIEGNAKKRFCYPQ